MYYHTVTLDAALREKLGVVSDQIEVQDEEGKLVGMYLPLEMYKYFLRNIKLPFTDEELEQARNSGGGCSLAEFWNSMEVS